MKSTSPKYGRNTSVVSRNAWTFGTTGQFISFPSNANYNIGTNSYTIECWVRFTSVTTPAAGAVCFVQGSNNMTGNTGTWWFGMTGTSGQPFSTLWMGQHGGSNVSGGVAWTPVAGVWYHVAVFRNGNTNTAFFVNGVQQGSTQSIAANYTSQAGVAIGSLTTSPSGIPFPGSITDVRYTLGTGVPYTSNFNPPRPGTLTAVSGCQLLTLVNAVGNTTITDQSANNATATNNGSVTAAAADIKYPSYGALVDPFNWTNCLLIHGENVSSTPIKDVARGQTLTTVGSVTLSNSQAKYNTHSISFPGTVGNYLSIASSTMNSMGAGNFTYEFWMRPDSTSNTGLNIPLSNFVHPIPFTNNAWGLYYNRTGNTKTMAVFCYNANTTSPIIESAANAISDLTWNHVLLVREGATLALFINGSRVGTYNIGTTSWDSGASLPLYIGAGSTDGSNAYPFKGFIEEVRVSKTARVPVAATTFDLATDDYDVATITYTGEVVYTTPGTYTFTVPAGVTSISGVLVGGGASGAAAVDGAGYANGGPGGALRYFNNMSVAAGQQFTVTVGAGGAAITPPANTPVSINAGGNSSLVRNADSATIVFAGGGPQAGATGPSNQATGTTTGVGAMNSTIGGGNGGLSGKNNTVADYANGGAGGGGGAGGYSGAGGTGGYGYDVSNNNVLTGVAPTSGSGGGGAGGGFTRGRINGALNNNSYVPAKGSGGGGVGLFGIGSSGTAGGNGNGSVVPSAGAGGSGGTSGTAGQGVASLNAANTVAPAGGTYGAGGGGVLNSTTSTRSSGAGGGGAVRIIWGPDRSFPSNAA